MSEHRYQATWREQGEGVIPLVIDHQTGETVQEFPWVPDPWESQRADLLAQKLNHDLQLERIWELMR